MDETATQAAAARAGGGDGQLAPIRQAKSQRDEFTLAVKIVEISLGEGGLAFRAPNGGSLTAIDAGRGGRGS